MIAPRAARWRIGVDLWSIISGICVSKFTNVVLGLVIACCAPASAHTCSDALSTLVATALKPALERTDLCKDLKQSVNVGIAKVVIGVDKTDKIELRSLQYCPAATDSSLEASVLVRCRTSDAAVVHTSVEETFDVRLLVDNSTCEVREISIVPHGDIGRLIASIVGFSDQLKRAAAEQIRVFCQ